MGAVCAAAQMNEKQTAPAIPRYITLVAVLPHEALSPLPPTVLLPTSPEPPAAVLLYANDIAVFSLAFPPAPSLGLVPSLVVVCVVDLFYIE
jgi:hypothetical protein